MDVTTAVCCGQDAGSEFDERLVDSIVASLERVPAGPDSDPIEIEVCDGVLTLRGAVLAREMIAVVEAVMAIPEIRGLDNQLGVRKNRNGMSGALVAV